MSTTPVMEYDLKINQTDVPLGGSEKASFKDGYNSIVIKFKSTNQSLNRFKVMCTYENEEWGLDEGLQICNIEGSIENNKWHTANIEVNSTNFSKGDGNYRLLLCARGDIDYTWDVTELFFVLRTEGSTTIDQFLSDNGDEVFEVLAVGFRTARVDGDTVDLYTATVEGDGIISLNSKVTDGILDL